MRRLRFVLPGVAVFAMLILAFWLAAAFLRMGFMPGEYAMWSARKTMLKSCDRPPTVIQGDSRAAAAFLPARLPGTTNLALGGSTPIEVYYVADALLKCGRPPRRVIISISPPLLMGSVFFWDRTVMFAFLDHGQLEEVRQTSRRLNDTVLFGPPRLGDWDAKLDDALHSATFPSYYSSLIVKHLLVGRLAENRRIAAATYSAGGQHGYGTDPGSSNIADEARMTAFAPSPLFNFYFERMLERYAARGTQVLYVAVPFNRSTYERVRPAVLIAYRAYLERLAARHPNFRIIGPTMVPLDDSLFGDSTHLNLNGAVVFSDDVRKTLARIQQ